MKVGVIGAGSISDYHLKHYAANPNTEVVMIADVNEELAKAKAASFNVPKYCADYKELLRDDTIEAVSITTPTFTHCNIVLDALAAGKHVLCEKPPALTAAEAEQCAEAAAKSGLVLMYAFVLRFASDLQYLKQYQQNGHLGNIYYGEASRSVRCAVSNGWFLDKKKAGGGMLMDAAIHELDQLLYLMGYPKPKSVLGFTTDANKDLYNTLQGVGGGWPSADKAHYERTIESAANGFVTFENGAAILVKSASIQFTMQPGRYVEVIGDKAGARLGDDLSIVTLDANNYMMEYKPILGRKADPFQGEFTHFVDCCLNQTPCIVKPEEAITLMSIINGIYKSAETGKPVTF